MKDQQDYKEMKGWLRRGDIKALRERYGISRSTASKILSGKSKNFSFMEAVINRAIENKQRGGISRLKTA